MIELKGETRSYQLDCAGTNALCRLEELTGRSHESVMAELRGKRARALTVRAFVWASLVDSSATVEDVGSIIDDIGGMAVIRNAARLVCRPLRVKHRRRAR